MAAETFDKISAGEAGTLAGLFRERVRRTPDHVAYRQFNEVTEEWEDSSWAEMAAEVARWQSALANESLQPGDRVAILMRNCREWVIFDQAALASGLVVVPLYTDDRAENIAYILNNAGVRLLFLQNTEQWDRLLPVHDQLAGLSRIITLEPVTVPEFEHRAHTLSEWLPANGGDLRTVECSPDELATIVYTSGTTGRPKGVMLSHRNIVWNAERSAELVPMYQEDVLLSFLPLSHTFERTVGYYIPMMLGSTVTYARSIPLLAEDLQIIRPTLMISVPRIYERVYNKIQAGLAEKPPFATKLFNLAVETGWQRFLHRQGRAGWQISFLLWPLLDRLVAGKIIAKLGGRMRLAASGGAALPTPIARVFIGLGLDLLQGYGLTETSPVISANSVEDNDPASVGIPLQDVELKIAEDDELLTRSPGIMMGYWGNTEATRDMIDAEGWLHTGDKAHIENNHVYITGRLKDIIVLANGEKVPPTDMEMAIALDSLFEQVMVIGENRPYLSAIIVLNPEQWESVARAQGLDPADPASLASEAMESLVRDRVAAQLSSFPGYAQIYSTSCMLEPWTIDNGLITPTLKLKRDQVNAHYADAIEKMYEGH